MSIRDCPSLPSVNCRKLGGHSRIEPLWLLRSCCGSAGTSGQPSVGSLADHGDDEAAERAFQQTYGAVSFGRPFHFRASASRRAQSCGFRSLAELVRHAPFNLFVVCVCLDIHTLAIDAVQQSSVTPPSHLWRWPTSGKKPEPQSTHWPEQPTLTQPPSRHASSKYP